MPVESSFESIRAVTGWVRPTAGHGCKPCEVAPGIWTAHYHDVDTPEKLSAVAGGKIQLIVNSAVCQCDSRPGHYGAGVEVVLVDLEDDPDARKKFDSGATGAVSALPFDEPTKNCAGDAKRDFARVSAAIDRTLEAGGATLIHCHASISRSAVFIIAHLMRTRGLSAVAATQLMKGVWGATWPCDRFVHQLVEYEKDLARRRDAPPQPFVALSAVGAASLVVASALAGAAAAALVLGKGGARGEL